MPNSRPPPSQDPLWNLPTLDSEDAATVPEKAPDPQATQPSPPPATAGTLASPMWPTATSEPPPSACGPGELLTAGTIVARRFRIEERIGGGGMGAVYKAVHLTLHVPVALKLLHPHVAARPEAMRRFRREAHVASRIQHNNVVKVLDFGDEDGHTYIAMEYIDGTSLADWLATFGAPPALDQVAHVFVQVASAIEAAHAIGVVHRDLKPENVMLARDSAGLLTVKVVDFGLAHIPFDPQAQSPLTRSDQVAGTPWYMSPEQCRSLVVGPATDVYALGCVLTTMLQLVPPFHQGAAAEIMTQHMYMPVPPLARPAGAEPIPLALERLRLDLLAKLPERRPGVADARQRFIAALAPGGSEGMFPSRKAGLPPGDRAERTNVWPNAPLPRSVSGPASQDGLIGVTLDKLASAGAGGVTEDCVIGLAAQSVRVHGSEDGARLHGSRVVVLDAGDAVGEACERVAELAGASAEVSVIVCVDGLSTDGMNRLIEAGAADVCRYPVRASDLARKVGRAARRRR